MNHSALKTFAQDARRKLRDLTGSRLDYILRADSAEHRQFAPQIKELEDALKKEGRDQLIERVAYTWFNRLAALRFMDANGYHPFGARVITPAIANETLPEILQQARAGALDESIKSQIPNLQSFQDILAGRIPVDHPEAEAFRILLVAVCNFYHRLMPFLFEEIGDTTELLLPDDLLTEHSIVADFRENLTDEDCRNEEVLGWFYQYYISEKKDEVMARNASVPKQDIPAVTQLFTPHWIVRYLIENSLGRLWLLNRPHSKLREKMPYYIEGEAETDFLKINKPEEIRLLDPACGSGHMLTYAFDLLYAIYEEEGFDAPEIPGLILRYNLYGVDICDRAVALAAFALCMKARAKDNRFFRRVVQPHLISLQEIRFEEGDLREYIRTLNLGELFNQPMLKLLHQFEEAKNFGALIQPCLDEATVAFNQKVIDAKDLGGQLFLRETHAKVLLALEQAEYLSQRYHVVVANPPYMGSRFYNPRIKAFVDKDYPNAKADLYGCFMIRSLSLLCAKGMFGMITIPNWMFLSSFEQLREIVLSEKHISSLVHIGRGVWGSDFGSCAFVIGNKQSEAHKAVYKRLFKRPGEVFSNYELEQHFLDTDSFPNFLAASRDLKKIKGYPIAYWVSEAVRDCFEKNPSLDSIAKPRQGATTSDNNRFLRFWSEVAQNTISLDSQSLSAAKLSNATWFPYNKGGQFQKWYGNHDYLINYGNDGAEIKAFHEKLNKTNPGGRLKNQGYYFRECVSWSKVSSGQFAARFFPPGFIFDVAGSAIFFPEHEESLYFSGFLNSIVVQGFLKAVSPTINYEAEHLACLPVTTKGRSDGLKRVAPVVNEAINLARGDWDSLETSWNFRDPPLLQPGLRGATLATSWRNWKAHCDAAIRRMQELETENNRLFITAYGLQDELKPEVPEDQITLARADARKDMAAFVSYAVGCMMGRYSLDKPGLILADAASTVQDYLAQVPNPTFAPDNDGIIPVLDGEWFPDDIVGQFRAFLRLTFSAETFSENLAFIESALEKDIRKYFVRDFYKNHFSQERAYGYKKRPIYWMISSPEGSFQALFYLHRYTKDTLNLVLNEYVRAFIEKLEERQRHLNAISLNEGSRQGDRTRAAKELGKIEKMLKEVRNWERNVLLPLAQKRIEIDLDNGVKVNYQKFPGILVPIPGLEKQEE